MTRAKSAAARRVTGPRAKSAASVYPPGPPAMAKAAAPVFVKPCLPRLVVEAPAGDDWVHEIKYDGYRVQALVTDGRARLFTRNGHDWSARFGRVAEEFAALPVASAVIDGEAIVEDAEGVSSFDALARSMKHAGSARILVMAFDLLHLDGKDLRPEPLLARKRTLEMILAERPPTALLQYGDHLVGDGPAILRRACEMRFEGIVSKHIHRPYRSGRLGDWVKAKCVMADPFLVVGYVPSNAAAETVGSLVLAWYDDARLVYAGRVGTGFSAAEAQALWQGLSAIDTRPPAFARTLTREQLKGVRWVAPRLVAQVAYRAWTDDGILRHASLQHFRQDKPPEEIGRPASLRKR